MGYFTLDKRLLRVLIAMSLLLFIVLSVKFVYAQQDAADEAISLARQQLLICFEAAAETEPAGADVSNLAIVLNEAGDSLSKAELAYSAGNFEAAEVYAIDCREQLDGFDEAKAELQILEQESGLYFLIGVAGSVFGFFLVIGLAFFFWVYLNQRYRELEG